MDLANVAGNVSDGVHIASAAGVWAALVFGFGGVRDYDGRLSFDRPAAARLAIAGVLAALPRPAAAAAAHADEEQYLVAEGDALEITVRGARHVLAPGTALILPAVREPVR